jgi:hypothetical protein
MSFGMKNGLTTYQLVVNKIFMITFLDELIVYNDLMNIPLSKLKICFQKCRVYANGINLNIDKCAFIIFSGIILGFVIFKERETT